MFYTKEITEILLHLSSFVLSISEKPKNKSRDNWLDLCVIQKGLLKYEFI